MLQTITTRKFVDPVVDDICQRIDEQNTDLAIEILVERILQRKVKFPLLEHVACRLFAHLMRAKQVGFLEELALHDYVGTSVVVGKMLGLRTVDNPGQSFSMARKFIIKWNSWYACDHTSERVFGTGILESFDAAYPVLVSNLSHKNAWVRRSVGIAIHYATKRGLDRAAVGKLAKLILPRTISNNHQEQRGIGWALKTISRYHPHLMRVHLKKLRESPEVGNWAIKKIETGISRSSLN